ncbi:MAG: pre-16S rRNA-processing nuclease YqgF [Anaerovibrio sp.]|uniref:pre-16S rRNA-processing nuclease YqgF n=1 Tax=Anaerovibrio sp. TaxID=1872532 RepID=UPI0025D28C4E|nr:pre-16S rRNA-processing nuclease YqgF [Anaerovibrio sp.]MCR5176173.1 pre-16S rRNA-processing nuclease YqgF [Anaerovibrio sp.]
MSDTCILGIDPGRDKCGVAILSAADKVCCQQVVDTGRLLEEVHRLYDEYNFSMIIIGNGTTSKEASRRLQSEFPDIQLAVRDEYYTTQLARKEYWKAKPPRGWRKLLPTSMQVPPEPVDDFVAVILAKRYFAEIKERL